MPKSPRCNAYPTPARARSEADLAGSIRRERAKFQVFHIALRGRVAKSHDFSWRRLAWFRRQALSAALRQRLPAGALRSVEFKDSRADVLIQLADMCADAIARAYKADRTRADRWLRALGTRIEDIWEFP